MNPKNYRSSWCNNSGEEYPVIYRVVLMIGYYSTYFDFKTMEEAGEFAKIAFMHHMDDERKLNVRIEVIPLNMFGENDKEDEDE